VKLPDLSRHPWITMAALAGALAGLGVLALFLVLVPMVRAAGQLPDQLGHAYQDYWNGVGQEFQQACEKTRGPDCQQYGGQP
jgi:hypothetical protein